MVRGRHQAFSHSPCPTLEPGKCCAAHADSTSGRLSDSRFESLCSTSLPHPGYVCGSVGSACAVSESLASTPQPVSLARPHHQTRLCDSVRLASPQVQGHPLHLCAKQRCTCLKGRDQSPPGEGRGRAGPSSQFYSHYFIMPKKGGGLQPIQLDLPTLNQSLHKQSFKMLKLKCIFECIHPRDWFAAVDLKDAYFHVSILPRHRPFLRFAFEGRAYQYKVLPFGLSLSSQAAIVPLRECDVRILSYLDDWLKLAQSRDQLSEHRDMVLCHLSLLGFWANWEKSKFSPVQRISLLGMESDSVNQTARLTEEHVQSVLICLNLFRGRTAAQLKLSQRLLGHMSFAAAVMPLELLHMRQLQHWLHGRVLRWAWQSSSHGVFITLYCC